MLDFQLPRVQPPGKDVNVIFTAQMRRATPVRKS